MRVSLRPVSMFCHARDILLSEPGNSEMSNENEKVDWIALAKIAFESFSNRRALEWKLAFGFWSAIGALTAAPFAVKGLEIPKWFPRLLAVFYVLLFVVAVVCWFWPLQDAHARDKQWWLYYINRAQGKPDVIEPDTNASWIKCWKYTTWFWFVGQILFTLLFLILSWFVLSSFTIKI